MLPGDFVVMHARTCKVCYSCLYHTTQTVETEKIYHCLDNTAWQNLCITCYYFRLNNFKGSDILPNNKYVSCLLSSIPYAYISMTSSLPSNVIALFN